MSPSATLVVGIGSPHGDDQAGWRVIDLLAQSMPGHCQLCRAKVPHELLDGLGDVQRMHVVDACATAGTTEGLMRFELTADSEQADGLTFVPADRREGELVGQRHLEVATLARAWKARHNHRERDLAPTSLAASPALRSGMSHHIDLMSVMRLAQALRKLPRQVVLWTIPGRHFLPASELDSDCETQVRLCAGRILSELSDA